MLVNAVMEKPTPTVAGAEPDCSRAAGGLLLVLFRDGQPPHPEVFDILDGLLRGDKPVTLSSALEELARQERYLAFVHPARRYDLGARYGLLRAQLALALTGTDRDMILGQLLELLAQRELDTPAQ